MVNGAIRNEMPSVQLPEELETNELSCNVVNHENTARVIFQPTQQRRLPRRDEANEDSVIYEYGFEDGWNGWSHVDLTDIGLLWHLSEEHAHEGNSWWCADEEIGGYNDHWLQYLITPPLNLSDYEEEEITLNFMLLYTMEPPEGAEDPYNGWDGCNVWISTDGGEEWEVIEPSEPEYDRSSLYSFGLEWGMGPDIPGWCGDSDGWVEAVFDLDDYAGQDDVRIRWAFCSDPAECTIGHEDWIGMLLDEIRITAGEDLILSNNGDEEEDEDEFERDLGPTSGDHWEITDEDANSGEFSAHCPIEPNLANVLVSPTMELPEEENLYFDFWIHSDSRMANPDGDNSLNDLYRIEYSTDNSIWRTILWDYGRSEEWWNNWIHYVPGLWYGEEGWRRQLDLSQFAGESIRLRWKVLTDDNMEGNQGTGFWIDDFRLLIGSGIIEVEPDELGFGNVELGEEKDLTITIRNQGRGDLTVSEIAVEGDYFSSDFEDEFTLDPNQAHELHVAFAPEEIGEFNGILTIVSDDADNDEIEIPLHGTGVEHGPDWIQFDDGNPAFLRIEENYWSKVTFSSQRRFELIGINFMPLNQGPNPDAPCWVRVYSENQDNHDLDELLWEAEIESLEPWNNENWDANWHWVGIPEDERYIFDPDEHFTIMYGPAPGGNYQNRNEGDGWWNVYDDGTEVNRSSWFQGDEPDDDHGEWVELNGDLFIRANGISIEANILVDSDLIDFGWVEVGDECEIFLNISNQGHENLTVSEIVVEGEFFDIGFRDEFVLEPDEVFELPVMFFAEEAGRFEGSIIILSDDPVNGELLVHLIGRGVEELEMVGERETVGTTWYEYQGNGTLSKMIAVDDDGGIHVTWTKSYDNRQAERHTVYNFYDPEEGEWIEEDGLDVDNADRSGYTNLSLLSDGSAAVFYHINDDSTTVLGIDWIRGIGAFENYIAPAWEGNRYFWPHGTIDRNDRAHIISHRISNVGNQDIQYVRGIPDNDNFDEWSFTDPVIIGRTDRNGYTCAASTESDKAALIYTQSLVEADNERWPYTPRFLNNDLYLFESEDGEDFDWENPINITQILRPDPDLDEDDPLFLGDTLRPYLFVDACYDGQDNLHIVFSTSGLWEATDPEAEQAWERYDERKNLIWHWDRDSGGIHLIADGWYETDGEVGNFRSNLSFPSIGVDDNDDLYCVFTYFPPEGDRAENGYVNGEIYATVSTDGGRSWAEATNLTNSHTPGAETGECVSECWSTLAEKVDDELHISYVLDLDAGAVVMNEGEVANCPFMYHQVSRNKIAREPLVEDRSFHVGDELIPPLRHFTGFIRTDLSHSLLINGLTFMGDPAPTGWEVGVFTPDGILAGGGVWIEGERLGMPAWGDDAQTEDIVEGFTADQVMHFNVWDDEADIEYGAPAAFAHGPVTWQVNGVSVLSLNAAREIQVPLNEGWSLISINITPSEDMWENDNGPDIVLMTEQLRIDEDNHRLIILKDAMGRFYLPAWGFNNIPYWDLTQGYQVKMNVDFEAVWSGAPIPADTDIPIDEGWNSIAYFPTYELDAGDPDFYVLSPIIDHVIVAKDGYGRFMLPAFDFSNMEPWCQTQGYMIKVDDDIVLNYPPEQEGIAVFSERKMNRPAHKNPYWTPPVSTESNMSVLVTGVTGFKINTGDQVAAFNSDGNIVGVGMFDTESRCGLAIWGDDPVTGEIEGLRNDEPFELRLWDADREAELKLTTVSIHEGKGLVYESNAFTVLNVTVEVLMPVEYSLSEAYPNPFNSVTRLTYGLPEASTVLIRIFDISGRMVKTLIEEKQPVGFHNVTWDGREGSSGLYLIKFEAGGFDVVRKVILLR